jgi:hypothetical protein
MVEEKMSKVLDKSFNGFIRIVLWINNNKIKVPEKSEWRNL